MPKIDNFKSEGKKITQYADAVLAMDVLTKKEANQVVSVSVANSIIKYHNDRPEAKLIDVIHDLINAEGVQIPPGENVVIAIGNTAYEVKFADMGDGNTKVSIVKQLTQEAGGIQLRQVNFPEVDIQVKKQAQEPSFSVKIDGHEVFNEKAPFPKEVQRETIAQFGNMAENGKPQQLAIMGTGTGKSWVLAGITHAVGSGVMIVPDAALAAEMKKDAIGILQGKAAEADVKMSTDFLTLADFEAALPVTKQMILVASDPLFHDKAKLVKDRVVLIDESHEHTFTPASIETLTMLRDNNALLAVTGTPTSKLKDLLCPAGAPAMVDVNVRKVMDAGGLRQNYRQTDSNVVATDLVKKAVEGYFARDEYLTRGLGVISIDDIRKKIAAGGDEKTVIDEAIQKNKERASTQKNFVFSGDARVRAEVLAAYEYIAKGKYPNAVIGRKIYPVEEDIDELKVHIRGTRREAEIKAREYILHELHPERDLEEIHRSVDREVKFGAFPNLKTEIASAQKLQIAMSVNTQALRLLYPSVKERDMEIMLRTGKIEEYLQNPENVPTRPNFNKLEHLFPGLPEEQRTAYIAKVQEIAERIYMPPDHQSKIEALCKEKDISLVEMKTQYTASATTATTEATSAAILDQLRTGLVMHVASDTKYATGISITSVLGVQQVVAHKDDALNDPVAAPQLHGRNIRANDRGAFNQQIVAMGVPQSDVVALNDIYHVQSGGKMDDFFVARRDKEDSRERFIAMKEQFEQFASANKPDEEPVNKLGPAAPGY